MIEGTGNHTKYPLVLFERLCEVERILEEAEPEFAKEAMQALFKAVLAAKEEILNHVLGVKNDGTE